MRTTTILLLLVTGFASVASASPAPSDNWPGGDPTVKPGADFFLFANGGWLDDNPIPADRAGFSMATVLTLSAAAKVRTLLEEAAADSGPVPSTERAKVGAYYAAFMDEARLEALGAAPLQHSLGAIRQVNSRAELARLMGSANGSFQGSLFKLRIEPDSRNHDRYAVYLGQAGLGSRSGRG